MCITLERLARLQLIAAHRIPRFRRPVTAAAAKSWGLGRESSARLNNLKYINLCLAHDAILSFYACLVYLDFKRLK